MFSLTLRADNLDKFTDYDHFTVLVANYIGDFSFSVTGSLAAGMEAMDLLGCIIVGFITALGGGTVRSILLGQLPVFWAIHWDEWALCVIVSATTFFVWPPLSHRFRLTSGDEWLFWTDTLGLGVFAATGAYSGFSLEGQKLHFFACACCGMFTATFGGVMRDILIARPPRILYSHADLYAVPAFLGGCATTFVVMWRSTAVMEAVLAGTFVTMLLRVIAHNHGLRLPTFPAKDVFDLSARPRDVAAAVACESGVPAMQSGIERPESLLCAGPTLPRERGMTDSCTGVSLPGSDRVEGDYVRSLSV